jgi:hypothetical protein
MLNLSALFLSQKRLNEVLNRGMLPVAARAFPLDDPRSSGLERNAVISAYEDAALKWLTSAKLPTSGELVAEDRLNQGRFFTHIGAFNGRGVLLPRLADPPHQNPCIQNRQGCPDIRVDLK